MLATRTSFQASKSSSSARLGSAAHACTEVYNPERVSDEFQVAIQPIPRGEQASLHAQLHTMLDAKGQTLEHKTNTKKPSHVSTLATRALLSRLANTPNMRTDIRYVTSYFVRKTTRQEALHMGICSFFTLSPDLSSPSSWQRSLSEGTVHFLDCASLFFLASLSSSSGNPEKLLSRPYHPFSQTSSQISQSSQSSHLNGQVRQARRPAPLDFFFRQQAFREQQQQPNRRKAAHAARTLATETHDICTRYRRFG